MMLGCPFEFGLTGTNPRRPRLPRGFHRAPTSAAAAPILHRHDRDSYRAGCRKSPQRSQCRQSLLRDRVHFYTCRGTTRSVPSTLRFVPTHPHRATRSRRYDRGFQDSSEAVWLCLHCQTDRRCPESQSASRPYFVVCATAG